MRLTDLYFKAFRALRKHTKDDPTSKKLRQAITHSNHETQSFTTVKYVCEIDVDWIENIEEGLIYVEKAIREDRQFIRTEGEIVPIEKVKKVSKASVEHLSRHSNFITRVSKDHPEDIIPDKLYIVEKLSDYLVYENRFIYLLLCYVKDFVQMRLNDIKDKTTTYQSELLINKFIEEKSRNIQYKLEYQDLFKNDPFLIDQYHEIPLIKRAETIYAIAVSLLATPLMKAVAKAPILKPPVIKTNVLRMNPNFKASLKLYDYITAYNQDGYVIEETKKTSQPLSPEMSDELAETIELTSVIGYVTGNELRDSLENTIQQEEKELLEAQNKKAVAKIKRLKKRIVEMNEDPFEYILMLEKRNLQLEKESENLASEIEKNNELSKKIDELRNDKLNLNLSINNLDMEILSKINDIDTLNQKYFDDMTEAETVHQNELKAQVDKYVDMIASIDEENLATQKTLLEQYNSSKDELIKKHLEDQNDITEKFKMRATISGKNISKLEQEINELKISIQDFERKITILNINAEQLDDENKFAKAQYLALRSQQGLLTEDDDYTSKEKFRQLELEMKAYKKLFKEQWKLTKLKIREQAKSGSYKNKKQ